MKSRAQEQEADSALARLSTFGISDQQLQESRLLVSGYVHNAGVQYQSTEDRRDLTALRRRAASLEGDFLGDAAREVDEVIEELSTANSGLATRLVYELLFLAYIAFLLGRIGYNFFWSSFLAPMFGVQELPSPLLSVDFYIPALIFLVIWSGVLVTVFSWKLRTGLVRKVEQFAHAMAESRLLHGLFPGLEDTCQRIQTDSQELTGLLEQTMSFKRSLADTSAGFLGGRLKHAEPDTAQV